MAYILTNGAITAPSITHMLPLSECPSTILRLYRQKSSCWAGTSKIQKSHTATLKDRQIRIVGCILGLSLTLLTAQSWRETSTQLARKRWALICDGSVACAKPNQEHFGGCGTAKTRTKFGIGNVLWLSGQRRPQHCRTKSLRTMLQKIREILT
jgi:hypothetical protein